jgi:hypothetical protein
MFEKINSPAIKDNLSATAQQAGLLLMGTAMAAGLLEYSDHANRIVLPNQPVMAQAGEHDQSNNPLRREREETAPHYISYSTAQRTPGRSGKVN